MPRPAGPVTAMWKLLRNLVLAALLLVGGGKLVLWAVAQQQAAAMAAQLSPWGALTYQSATATLKGSMRLDNVEFAPAPKSGLPSVKLRAAQVFVRTPGPFWLLRRSVTRDMDIPDALGISVVGPVLPQLDLFGSGGERGWLGATSLVPFETQGCGIVTRLSAHDFQSMGLTPAAPRLRLDYRYDSADRSLDVDVAVRNEPFGNAKVHAEIEEFSSLVWTQPAARKALRVSSLEFDYADTEYLERRNRFCAQHLGVTPDAFADMHIAAVQEFLKSHNIVPAEEVVALYARLVKDGGKMRLLSLPNPNVPLTQYASYDPEEVLRFLSLTARIDDTPPILFKLFFLADPAADAALADIDPDLVHDPLAEPATGGETVVVKADAPDPPATTRPVESVVVTPPATPPSIDPRTSTAAVATRPPPVTPAATVRTTVATVPTPPPVIPPVAKPPTPPPTTTPATTAPRTAAPTTVRTAPAETTIAHVPSPRTTTPTATAPARPRIDLNARNLPPSAPPPPPNSTQALVWQGATIERLPDAPVRTVERSFRVLGYEALPNHVGARVQLITSGGKELEGNVDQVDDSGVTLSVQRETGRARFHVERSRILEIRLQLKARG
jgi:hypothetical protein